MSWKNIVLIGIVLAFIAVIVCTGHLEAATTFGESAFVLAMILLF